MNFSKLWERVKGREAWSAAVYEVTNSHTWLTDWTTNLNLYLKISIILFRVHFESVQFSGSVVSDSLQPNGLQHARPPCPSPTPWFYPNLCPLSQWGHPTISSSVIPFSSHLQPFPAPGSFPMSQFFISGGQSIGDSVSTSELPMNSQDWSPLRWTGLISLLSKGFQESSPAS